MNYYRTFGFLVAIVLLYVVASAVIFPIIGWNDFIASTQVLENEKMERESERSIGGSEAEEGQFPWMAALYFKDQHICSASILSPNTVMTAGHCIFLVGQLRSFNWFHAIANVNRKSPSYRIDFTSVALHPDYNDDTVDNDVAIFTTNQSIPFSDAIHSVCIASPNTKMNQYKTATAMDWGFIGLFRDSPKYPENLLYVNQTVVNNSLCSSLNKGINENKICAKGFFNAVCIGDSGGPLVHLSNPPVQIGIASYINPDAGCGSLIPAVFARVSNYYDFIMKASGDSMICNI